MPLSGGKHKRTDISGQQIWSGLSCQITGDTEAAGYDSGQ